MLEGGTLGCQPAVGRHPRRCLCLWLRLWGAQFVVHVSVEVRLALGFFEGEERNGIVRFF